MGIIQSKVNKVRTRLNANIAFYLSVVRVKPNHPLTYKVCVLRTPNVMTEVALKMETVHQGLDAAVFFGKKSYFCKL